jgi:hypothetical protein
MFVKINPNFYFLEISSKKNNFILKNPSSGIRVDKAKGWMDGRTDITKLTGTFRNF